MPDQVVIEFVADASKLQPAVDNITKIVGETKNLETQVNKTSDSQVKANNVAKVGIDQLSASVKNLNKDVLANAGAETLKKFGNETEKVVTTSKRLTTQLREIKQELSKMEEAGLRGTKQFEKMAIAAGKLEDQIGDTANRVRVLASDTKNLDAGIQVVTGLAGAFSIAQGAAGLLGDENEDLQKALLRVQSAMAVLNGLQAVSATLNKDSAASVVIYGGALKVTEAIQKQFAISSAAAWAVATAGVTLLIAGVVSLIAYFRRAKDEAEDLNDTQAKIASADEALFEGMKRRNEEQVRLLEQENELAKLRGATLKEQHENEIELVNQRISVYQKAKDDEIALTEKQNTDYQILLNERALIDARYTAAVAKELSERRGANVEIIELEQADITAALPVPEESPEVVSAKAIDSVKNQVAEQGAKIRKEIAEQEAIDRANAQAQEYQAAVAFVNQLFSLNNAALNNRIAQIQAEADSGTITQKRAHDEIAKIKRKEAIANKESALFNIAINTTIAASKVTAEAALLAPLLIPIIIALGAAQAATVLAQPIPKFAKGTKNAPAGMKLVGEEGPELIMDQGGYPIIPNKETQKILAKWDIPSLNNGPESPFMNGALIKQMELMNFGNNSAPKIDYARLAKEMARELGNEIKAHPKAVINIDQKGFHQNVQEGLNEKKYWDKNFSWNG